MAAALRRGGSSRRLKEKDRRETPGWRSDEKKCEISLARGSWRRLVDLENLIGGNVFECLQNAAGPADFDGLGHGFGAEAEMNTLVARGQIAARSGNGGELLAFRGDEFYFGADGIAVAFVADQFQGEPMVLCGCFVAEDVGGAVVRGY